MLRWPDIDMPTRYVLFLIDFIVLSTIGYWLSLESDAPDWLFVAPHSVFILALAIAIAWRLVNARRGTKLAVYVYGMMMMWGIGLVVLASLPQSRDGVHLAAYGVGLASVAAILMFFNIAALRHSTL